MLVRTHAFVVSPSAVAVVAEYLKTVWELVFHKPSRKVHRSGINTVMFSSVGVNMVDRQETLVYLTTTRTFVAVMLQDKSSVLKAKSGRFNRCFLDAGRTVPTRWSVSRLSTAYANA